MLGLPLEIIGFAHRRARQPVAQLQLMKQPLTLAHAQWNLVTLPQALRQRFAVPQVDLQSGLVWRLA